MHGTASRESLFREVKEEAEGRGTRAKKTPPVSRAFARDDATPRQATRLTHRKHFTHASPDTCKT